MPRRRPRQRPPRVNPVPAVPVGTAGTAESPRRLARVSRFAWVLAAAGVVGASGAWMARTNGDADAIAPRSLAAPARTEAEAINASATTDSRSKPGSGAAPAGPAGAAARTPAPGIALMRETLDPRTLPSSIALPRAADAALGASASAPRAPAPANAGGASMPGLSAFGPVDAPRLPPVVVAQAPMPKAAPDRWQRLADALARCPADDTIARTVCQESLRIEHCVGHYGRVPACPAREEREYGN